MVGQGERTSRNCTWPNSPNALTTSRPISVATYSWTSDMSAERKSVSSWSPMAKGPR